MYIFVDLVGSQHWVIFSWPGGVETIMEVDDKITIIVGLAKEDGARSWPQYLPRSVGGVSDSLARIPPVLDLLVHVLCLNES